VTDAHARNFAAYEKLPLPILKTFAYYTILEMIDVLCLVIEQLAVIPSALRQTRPNLSLITS
jgi:hypothetical protein